MTAGEKFVPRNRFFTESTKPDFINSEKPTRAELDEASSDFTS